MTVQTVAGDMIITILQILITGVAVMVARYVIPWIKSKIEDSLGAELAAWIESAVWAAQQTITGNEDKKTYVIKKCSEWLEARGLSVSNDDLNMLIESAVLAMKQETAAIKTQSN